MFLLEIFLEIFERIQEFESTDPRKGLSKSFNILSWNQKCLNSMIFLELDTNPLKFQIRETHEEDRKGDYTRFS